MGTVPPTRTWTPYERLTAALLNTEVRDALDFLLSTRPLFWAVQAVEQSLANATWTPLTFTSHIMDRDGGHSTAVNVSRYVGKTPGYYEVQGVVAAYVTTGGLVAALRRNGASVKGAVSSTAGISVPAASAAVTPTFVVYMNGSTDYVEVWAYQSTGAAVNSVSSADFASMLRVKWLST